MRVAVASGLIAGALAVSPWLLAPAQLEAPVAGVEDTAVLSARTAGERTRTEAVTETTDDDAPDADAGSSPPLQAEADEPLVVPAVRKPLRYAPAGEGPRQSGAASKPARAKATTHDEDDDTPPRAQPRPERQSVRIPASRTARPEWRHRELRDRGLGEGRRIYRDREIVWERRPRWPFFGFGLY